MATQCTSDEDMTGSRLKRIWDLRAVIDDLTTHFEEFHVVVLAVPSNPPIGVVDPDTVFVGEASSTPGLLLLSLLGSGSC